MHTCYVLQYAILYTWYLLAYSARGRTFCYVVRFGLCPHDVSLRFTRTLLQYRFFPQTPVGLPQCMSLVPAQDDNCTVGEVEEGTTLVGFPNEDVCVAAT